MHVERTVILLVYVHGHSQTDFICFYPVEANVFAVTTVNVRGRLFRPGHESSATEGRRRAVPVRRDATTRIHLSTLVRTWAFVTQTDQHLRYLYSTSQTKFE
jgi:hypothetical protein